MSRFKKVWLWVLLEIIFIAVVCALEIFGVTYSGMVVPAKIVFRIGMLVPLFILISKSDKTSFSKLLLINFVIIAIADLVLIFNFMAGLGVFLICHIINMLNYYKLYSKNDALSFLELIVVMGLGLSSYFLVLFFHLPQDLLLRIVMTGYLIVVLTAVWRSVNLFHSKNVGLAVSASVGYILFYLCDFEVAYVTFVQSFPFYQVVNNIIYYVGLTGLAISAYYEDIEPI